MAKWTVSGGGQSATTLTNSGVDPGRGMVHWQESLSTAIATVSGDNSSCSQQPCAGSYHRYNWSDLESDTTPGDYSKGYALIDAELANAKARGGWHGLAINCLFENHTTLPLYITSDPTYNTYTMKYATTDTILTVVPDWNNAAFLARLQALIKALGARYDLDPRLGLVEETLYGHYGEWHMNLFASVGPNGQIPITKANKLQIVDWWYQYFPHTRILVTTSENETAAYSFAKSPLIPSGVFRQSGGDASWANLDQDNASSGSGDLHGNCDLAEWVNASHASIRSFVSFNDQAHTYGNAPYNIKATIQGTTYQYIQLAYRKTGTYPQQAIDVGTANPYGATHLRIVVRAEGTGIASEAPSAKLGLIGQGALAFSTLSAGAVASGTLVDAGFGVGGVGYQNPTLTVKKVGTGTGSGATFPALTVTNGVVQALPAPSAPGSAYIAAPDLQIIDAGAFPASIALSTAGIAHNEAGGAVTQKPVATGWTIYDIPLSSLLSTSQAAHNYCNEVLLEFNGTRTNGDIYYIGQWGLCTGPGTPLVYTFYDGSQPGLPGAWNSTVKNLWKTAPFHMEAFGGTTVLDNTAGGVNGQINTYKVATFANGNILPGGYSALTAQQKGDWDNVASGAKYGTGSLYSAAGYQFQFKNAQGPQAIYPGLAFPVTLSWTNLGSAPEYDGLIATWQVLSGSTVVYSKKSNVSFLTLPPMCGVSPATWTDVVDDLVIPAAQAGNNLTLQLVVTHAKVSSYVVTFPNLLTLTAA